jgi:AAA domain
MGETFGHRMIKLMEDHFVGREFELRFFEQFLSGMPERSERIINVYGTAGIGKSYLLDRYERISRQGGAATVSIDVREAYGQIEAFSRMILSALEQDEGSGHQENVTQRTVNAINDSASKRKTVLLIDGYEEIGGLDYELRQRWLPRLDSNVLIVIAGRFPLEGPWRYSPAWKRLIARLALTELSYEDIRMYLLGLGFQDDQVIDTLWLRTLGHPLSLSLLMPAGEGEQDPRPSEWEPVDDRIHHWLQEAPDEELRQLLYAWASRRRRAATISLMAMEV